MIEMKKKVGLITMHRVANHGSVLQALATQRAIEQLGYDCELIDYAYPTDEHLKRIGLDWYPHERDLWQLIKKTIRRRPIAETYKRLEYFYWFRKKYLKTTRRAYYSNEEMKKDVARMPYDIFCVGSDQVWNPTYTMDDGAFVLDFVPDGKKKISYSSSFVVKAIEDKKQVEFYGSHLKRFDAISVREQSGVEIVREITGKNAVHVMDPVFLLGKEEWNKLLGITEQKQPYVLFYSLNYMADTIGGMVEFMEKMMKNEEGLSCIVSNKKIKSRYDVHVVDDNKTKQFVERIANASLVITDSFHASAFAMIYGVPVYGISGNKNDDRLYSLYQQLGITERFICSNNPSKIALESWNGTELGKGIELLRTESINYLKQVLS